MSLWLVPTAEIMLRLSLWWKPLCSTAMAMIRLQTNIMLVPLTFWNVWTLILFFQFDLEVEPGHLVSAGHPCQGEQHQRQQRGDGERQQLQDPVQGHHFTQSAEWECVINTYSWWCTGSTWLLTCQGHPSEGWGSGGRGWSVPARPASGSGHSLLYCVLMVKVVLGQYLVWDQLNVWFLTP